MVYVYIMDGIILYIHFWIRFFVIPKNGNEFEVEVVFKVVLQTKEEE